VKLFTGFLDTTNIIAIDKEYQSLCVVEIMALQCSNPFLAPGIPDIHVESFVLDRFSIASDCRDCPNWLSQLQLVQNRCLSSVEPQHQAPVSLIPHFLNTPNKPPI
jgi:phosphoribulokinase